MGNGLVQWVVDSVGGCRGWVMGWYSGWWIVWVVAEGG